MEPSKSPLVILLAVEGEGGTGASIAWGPMGGLFPWVFVADVAIPSSSVLVITYSGVPSVPLCDLEWNGTERNSLSRIPSGRLWSTNILGARR